MQSINDFVKARMEVVRQRNLATYDGKIPDQYNTKRSLDRRAFMRSAVATIALATTLTFLETNYARAANAVVYVDSGAAGANNGTSWVNAYTTLAAAITASGTTGTDFYVKNTHTESSTALTFSFKGVAATPDRLFSCDATNSPPQTSDLLAGAAFTATAGTLNFNGFAYCYGMTLSGTTTNNGLSISLGSSAISDLTLDTCSILQPAAGAGNIVRVCGSNSVSGYRVTWVSCTYQVSNAGSYITANGGVFRWINGSVTTAGTLPTNLFNVLAGTTFYSMQRIDGVDLSVLSAKTLVAAGGLGPTQFINCRLPASVTLAGTPTGPGAGPLDFIVTDSTVANTSSFIQTRYMYQGTLTADGTVYNGATDGSNPMSWKVVTTANANAQSPFECFEIVQWVAPGTYAASKVFATSATAGLTNSSLWAHAEYLGNASYPLASRVTSGNSPLLPQGTSPGSVATGASWSVGGAGTNYSIAIPSFTTALAGYVRIIVRIANAPAAISTPITVWVDPKVTIA